MKLSRKDIRNLIIAGVVLIVIGLIIWRWKFKSDYVVTSITSTAASGTTEASLYANLSACQNTFVTTEYANIAIHSNIWCSGQTVKATCDAAHGYSSGDLITVRGVSGDGTQTITGYNGDNMQVSVVDSYTYTYTSASCSQSGEANWTVFADSNNGTQGISWLTNKAITTAANVIRSTCFSDNVSTYISNTCPNSVSGYVPANGHSSYNAYQLYLANKATIVAAYSKLINNAPATATASSPSRAQYEAARKADLTAALRKYLADACTNFYLIRGSSTDVNPGTTSTAGYILSPYTSYTNVASSTDTTIARFDPALITAANVTNWATYATWTVGNVSNSGTKATFTTSGSQNVFNVSGGEFPSGTKNSDVAAIIGPGTITKSGPITGTTRSSGSIPSFLTMAAS